MLYLFVKKSKRTYSMRKKSTGLTSVTGKATFSMNALNSGTPMPIPTPSPPNLPTSQQLDSIANHHRRHQPLFASEPASISRRILLRSGLLRR